MAIAAAAEPISRSRRFMCGVLPCFAAGPMPAGVSLVLSPAEHGRRPGRANDQRGPARLAGHGDAKQVDDRCADQADEQPVPARGRKPEDAAARQFGPPHAKSRHRGEHQREPAEEHSGLPSPGHPAQIGHQTRPRAKPLAMWLRTNQITNAPGISVSVPAAANSPQSMPAAEMVRVMMAAIGLALTVVSVRASSSSTQLNMKQKKAATPIPLAISGRKMRTKKRGKEYPSICAVSSISRGTPDMKPSRIHTASGTLNKQCASAIAQGVSNRPTAEYRLKNGSANTAGGAIRF